MRKIHFEVDSVLPQLTQALAAIAQKNALPILNDFVIRTMNSGSYATVTASDMDIWVELRVPMFLDEPDADVELAVNATDFVRSMRALAGRAVSFSVDDGILSADYGNGSFKLPCDNAQDFPAAPQQAGVTLTIAASQLSRSLTATLFAAGHDELRPVLGAIHLELMPAGIVSVATDTHKLAKLIAPAALPVDGTRGVTIPMKAAKLIAAVIDKSGDEKVNVAITDNVITVTTSQSTVVARLLEGRYPNADSVMPKEAPIRVVARKDDVISALRRVMLMGNTTSELVSLALTSGAMTFSACDIDFSKEGSEKIQCDYQGDDFTISFKGSALMLAVDSIQDENIIIGMSKPYSAATIEPCMQQDGTYITLLMPMLVNTI